MAKKTKRTPAHRQDGADTQVHESPGYQFVKWLAGSVGAVVIAFAIALVSPVAGDIHDALSPRHPDLVLEDVAFTTGSGDQEILPRPKGLGKFNGPILDVNLENTGSQAAFITRADILIQKEWTLEDVGCNTLDAAVHVSGIYPIILPEEPSRAAPGMFVSAPIREMIKANDVDRFLIELDTPKPAFAGNADCEDPSAFTPPGALKKARGMHIYMASLRLVYNQQSTASSTILFGASSEPQGDTFYCFFGGKREMAHDNEAIREMRKRHAIEDGIVESILSPPKPGEKPGELDLGGLGRC